MAESAVTVLVKQLSIWLQEQQNLLGGLRDEALIIRGELEQMRAFLRVADAREEDDPQLKEWARQVRDIAYDIEDVLESYMVLCASGIQGRMKKLCASIKSFKAKHKLAYKIKALRFRTESASKTFRDMYVVLLGSNANVVASSTWYDGRGDALLLAEADLVGIERPKQQLLSWISTIDYKLKVVSVVGMAGLGKTTLVKKVYDDPLVKKKFDHHAWITVSETYIVKDLLLDLIMQLLQEVKQAPPPELETMNVDCKREFIHNFLQNKTYMIVLDDVWSINVWEALRYVFPRSSTYGWGSIIITTRLNTVGNPACCESGGHVYHLNPLPRQEAEKLFLTKAFPSGSCPGHLKELSRNILKRCEGLPLAIVVIGSALATKGNEIEEWTKFSLSLESNADGDTLKRMWKLLSLSYYDLPYYLKCCLLYLSIFQEDALFEKATILRLWVAEGFVEAKQGKTMEETAEGYLIDLCNRSLVQVATTSRDGKPRKFRIHDLIREYIISKAREQNIVAIKSQGEITWDDRIRRLSLDDNFISYSDRMNNFKYLRTLLFFGSVNLEWGPIICKVLHDGCRMLKVLDLRGAPLDTMPNEIFELYCLKYLCLRNTNISLIPKLIGNLIKLEILDLKGSKVVELPIEILNLRRLRYFLVYRHKVVYGYLPFGNIQSFEAPYEIGQLSCLEKLCYIDASRNIVREIGRLTKLRRLGVKKLRKEDGKELCSSLANLAHLSSLVISSLEELEEIDLEYSMPPTSLQFLRSLALEGRLERLPQWIPSLKALTCLRLRWSRINKDPLEYLQSLPNLQILEMYYAFKGEELCFKSGGFQRLKRLYLDSLEGLRFVTVEKGSLPCLKTLAIRDCKAITELPMGIEHLTNLNYVGLIDMSEEFDVKLFEEKRREGHQWKLAHVPKIGVANWVDGQYKGRWL